MRLLNSGLLGLVIAFTVNVVDVAQAQDDPIAESGVEGEISLYKLPEGRRCRSNGNTFQCFDLGEYKLLLQMDADLRFLDGAYPAAVEESEALRAQTVQLTLALDAANAQIAVLQVERDRLHERWADENLKRLEAENRPMLGSYVAWALVAAEAVALVTVFIVGVTN